MSTDVSAPVRMSRLSLLHCPSRGGHFGWFKRHTRQHQVKWVLSFGGDRGSEDDGEVDGLGNEDSDGSRLEGNPKTDRDATVVSRMRRCERVSKGGK